jgi:hypothetical protein
MSDIRHFRIPIERAARTLQVRPDQLPLLIADVTGGTVAMQDVLDAAVVLLWPMLREPDPTAAIHQDPSYQELAAIVAASRAASGPAN